MSSYEALNRLAKWRTVLAGWQLGTRSDTDPEAAAVRDTRELLLVLRAEVNALTDLLIGAGIFRSDQWDQQMVLEAEELERRLEARFPGMKATDAGIEMTLPEAQETMRRLNFKP